MAYDNTNRGVLFINDKKGNPKAPDRTGTLDVNGVEYKIAGWVKEGKKGPFLSLSIQPKDGERKEKVELTGATQTPITGGVEDDEIPF